MTEIEVVSMALERLGSDPITAIPDPAQKHAAKLARFLAFFRDEMLQTYAWPWVLRRRVIVDIEDLDPWATGTAYLVGDYVYNATVSRLYRCIADGTGGAAAPSTTAEDITVGTAHFKYITDILENLSGYEYRYPLPPDCLRVTKVNEGEEYRLEGQILYSSAVEPETTLDGPILTYVAQVTDYANWDHLMLDALIARLAAAAAPIVTGKVRSDLLQEYVTWYELAIKKQRAEATQTETPDKPWIEAGQ